MNNDKQAYERLKRFRSNFILNCADILIGNEKAIGSNCIGNIFIISSRIRPPALREVKPIFNNWISHYFMVDINDPDVLNCL